MPTGQPGIHNFSLKCSFQMILGWLLKLTRAYFVFLVSLSTLGFKSLWWTGCLVVWWVAVSISFSKVPQSAHPESAVVHFALFCLSFICCAGGWRSLSLSFETQAISFGDRCPIPLGFLDVFICVFSFICHTATGAGKCPGVTDNCNLFIISSIYQHSWKQHTRSLLSI